MKVNNVTEDKTTVKDSLSTWAKLHPLKILGVFQWIKRTNSIYDQICKKVPFPHTKFDLFVEL